MRKRLFLLGLVVVSAGVGFYFIADKKEGEMELADKLEWKYLYDDLGRPSGYIDPAGVETRVIREDYVEGAKSRKWQVRTEEEVVQFELDDEARTLVVDNGSCRTVYGHDSFGRIEKVQQNEMPELRYHYDTMGRVKSYSVGAKHKVSYEYDVMGDLEGIDCSFGKIVFKNEPSQGTVSRVLPNGVKSSWIYGPEGKLKELIHQGKSEEVIAKFTYSYDSKRRISDLESSVAHSDGLLKRSWIYKYDSAGCLDSARELESGELRDYTYDPLGNLLSVEVNGKIMRSWESDGLGRLMLSDADSHSHDSAGNLDSFGDHEFSFGPGNRLASARGGDVNYHYDGRNRMTGREVAGVLERFLSNPLTDRLHPLASGQRSDELSYYLWHGEALLAEQSSSKSTNFFLTDHLGSVIAVVDQDGRVSGQREYSPFGVLKAKAASLEPGFGGLIWDAEAGIYLTGSRGYLPTHGRFLQPDPRPRIPMGDTKDLSLFSYCGGDPVNFVDKNGAEPIGPFELENKMSKWWPNWWRQHLNREKFNKVPDGVLTPRSTAPVVFHYTPGGNNEYVDQSERIWHLKPDSMNAMHQLKNTIPTYNWAYWNSFVKGVSNTLTFKSPPEPPTLFKTFKFVSPADDGRGSYEAIFVPGKTGLDFFSGGHWKVTGPKRGTFNFSNPEGPWYSKRSRQHIYWDMIPHTFVGGNQYIGLKEDIPYGHRVHDDKQFSNHAKRILPPSLPHIDLSSHIARFKNDDDDIGDFSNRNLFFPPGGGGGGWGSRGPSLPPPSGGGSPVGGVFLGGASSALAELGTLTGLVLDPESGNLILISEGEGEVGLPPLRLEDVVVIFRSVFNEGVAPTVTIDPVKGNLRGPMMDVINNPTIANTYVGWVLYECDRIMKRFNLGEDNITREKTKTLVPGYEEVLDSIYFGGTVGKQTWERFWIVPKTSTEYQGGKGLLSRFELPLKVNTQKMKVVGGKLVDDRFGKSSPGAQKFTKWFTDNYDKIAEEIKLVPPPETGIMEPVAIYKELSRIAMIAAIAEKMNQDGAPTPLWMRNYDVTKVTMDEQTPSMEVIRENGRAKAKILGGVNLAAQSDVRKSYNRNSKIFSLPLVGRSKVKEEIGRTEKLERKLEPVLAKLGPVEAVEVTVEDGVLRAAALPGAKMRGLSPHRMVEPDLQISLPGGGVLALERRYNSFFNPREAWERGWSLDLPQLHDRKLMTKKGRGSSIIASFKEISSPFGSTQTLFNQTAKVKELGGASLLVPSEPDSPYLACGNASHAIAGRNLSIVALRDGRKYWFNKDGLVRAIEGGSRLTLFEWSDSKLASISSLDGKHQEGKITITYNPDGTASGAFSSDGQRVEYGYREARLSTVTKREGSSESVIGYQYKDSFVVSKSRGGEEVSSFKHDGRGRLVSVSDGSENEVSFKLVESEGGRVIDTVFEGKKISSQLFDRAGRLVRSERGDFINKVKYGNRQAHSSTLSRGEELLVEQVVSEDGRRHQTTDGACNQWIRELDANHRPERLAVNGEVVVSQKWNKRGRLESSSFETGIVRPKYDGAGTLRELQYYNTGGRRDQKASQVVHLDEKERVRAVESPNGEGRLMEIEYDEKHGGVKEVVVAHGKEAYRYNLFRDFKGRLTGAKSTFGEISIGRKGDDIDQISHVFLDPKSKKRLETSMSLEAGRIKTVREADGAMTHFEYDEDQLVSMRVPSGIEFQLKTLDEEMVIDVGESYTFRTKQAGGRIQSIVYEAK